ncbi:hypothetical protein K501DRAFT_177398, partial [Backusella circina FSU 941]
KCFGFKTDIQFIKDHDDQEFDIGVVELSLPEANSEIIQGNEGKFLRGGRINTTILNHVLKDVSLVRLVATFSTVIYHGNDLFVGVPQFSITFPLVFRSAW